MDEIFWYLTMARNWVSFLLCISALLGTYFLNLVEKVKNVQNNGDSVLEKVLHRDLSVRMAILYRAIWKGPKHDGR